MAQLADLRDRYSHVRLIFQPDPAYDPEGFVGQWFEECCEKLDDRFVAGFRLQTYDTPLGSLAARRSYPVTFENGAQLTGFRLVPERARPGATVHLTLYWTTRRPLAVSYTVFVHVRAPDGFNVLGADSLPGGGRRPSDHWVPGADVIDAHPIALPPELPRGEYRVVIGLYRLATGERVRLAADGGLPADEAALPVTLTVIE
jgi:hypothetical protein